MSDIVLSIIVPTYNRKHLLGDTLSVLLHECKPYQSQIQFLICNNTSVDGTEEWLDETFSANKFVEVVHFREYKEAVDNFKRGVELATGKYIWIFGDDDFIQPGCLKLIMEYLDSDRDYGAIHLNRISVSNQLDRIIKIEHTNIEVMKILELGSSEFIEKCSFYAGFVTSVVFNRLVWDRGQQYFTDRYLGYNFLGPIYGGLGDFRNLFIPYPMVIQRAGIATWLKDWPVYWLVSMPTLLNDMDKLYNSDSLSNWERDTSFISFIKILLLAKASGLSSGHSFWARAVMFQRSRNKVGLRIVQYLVAGSLVALAYRIKNRK